MQELNRQSKAQAMPTNCIATAQLLPAHVSNGCVVSVVDGNAMPVPSWLPATKRTHPVSTLKPSEGAHEAQPFPADRQLVKGRWPM